MRGHQAWQGKRGGFLKAITYTEYGSPDVLQVRETSKPTPLDDEVLIEVHAASVNAYDWHFLTADVFLIRLMGGGLRKPKRTTLGADVAGNTLQRVIPYGGDQLGNFGVLL